MTITKQKMIQVALAILLCMLAFVVSTGASYRQFEIQAQANERANQVRAEGYPETDERIIKENKIWWKAQNEFHYDRDLIATAIFKEAWADCSDRHRELVAAVIYNRLNSKVWPNSVYEILAAPKQYSKSYVTPGSSVWMAARANPEVWSHCQSIAEKALRGQVICPPGVVYQSTEKQGKLYEKHKTFYSTTYFCYGRT